MNPNLHEADIDDPRILEVARDYMAELEAGRKPERQAYLTRYPELNDAIAECLDGIDLAQTLRPRPRTPELELPNNPLGDFQILREIGRGGMGIVYEAVQLSLGRRVALKVLPFAAALDARHLQRFKTEAHAAAQLHHTNIVPVYAVGCERGVHFYAMQLIDGRPLDEVIRELRKDISSPKLEVEGGTTIDLVAGQTPPSIRDVPHTGVTTQRATRNPGRFRSAARIIAQVADALEYAHDAGVIHRDIKPANLLLDGRGNIWVTDFGLAHVSADVSLTQTGDMVGTLRYMSPEQAAGKRMQVDHRTDIYSLGATLYELLTLEPLFPANDRQSLLHQILHEEPRGLRSIDRSIPVELETIVLKALAKSPNDRYLSAADFAADLRLYLENRPIRARRPSIIDRTRKWMRRHPGTVGTGMVLLVLGLLGLAIATAMITREQARTKEAYDLERTRAQQAEARFQLARRSVDQMIQLSEEELIDNPQLESIRRRILEAALVYYQEFIEQRRDDPDAQAELSVTRDRVRKIIEDLEVLQGAGQHYLLANNSVLDDLKVDEKQRSEISELMHRHSEKRNESFREFYRLASEERRQRFLELARSNKQAIDKILKPTQILRLRQIALQIQGVAAFRDPDIVAELKLSSDQRLRLRMIEMEMFASRSDGLRFGPLQPSAGGPGSPSRKGMDSSFKAAMEKAEAVLTADQLARWKTIVGDPFKNINHFLFPGRGGPFGGRPRSG